MVVRLLVVCGALILMAGCGTTRWSDTPRTATEQLLLSDAMDRAVSKLDFNLIANRDIYLDTSPVKQNVDAAYLISSVRQHLLASGCVIKDKPDEADYVIEIRAGAVGTDRHDLLFGVPATSMPSATPGGGMVVIPELPLAKRTEQRAVAKIAVFVYERESGRPIWQSGTIPVESRARDLWVFGAGPFQRGSIYNGTKFAGGNVPLVDLGQPPTNKEALSVTQEAVFTDPQEEALAQRRKTKQVRATKESPKAESAPVISTGLSEPAADSSPWPQPMPQAHSQPSAQPAGPSGTTNGISTQGSLPRLPTLPNPFRGSSTTQPTTTGTAQ